MSGCQKENPTTAPVLTTSAVTSIGALSATCGGTITSIGGELIKEQGVCWGTSANPTIADLKVVDATGLRTFTVTLTNLSEATTYHVRAYATNAVGTSYGEDISFTTSAIPLPIITTTAISNLSYITATSGGTITIYGGVTISAKGVCWSTTANPTTADSKTTDGMGGESFTSSITGLSIGTTYHVRAYAVYATGTAYGNDISFTTLVPVTGVPLVTTNAISSISFTTATSGGVIAYDGGVAITAKGVCWSTATNPTTADSKTTDGTGPDTFTSSITGLSASTYYHVRAYATNSVGTAYGSDVVFKTLVQTSTPAENMLLGNPSGATTNILTPDNYYMEKPQYSLSYSNTKRTTNWTSWHVYSGDIGSTSYQGDFRADATLPSGWYQVTQYDYAFSTYGFDRGHVCPSADRTSSVENNSATFVMTNMIPQAQQNNQQTWADLENYGRTLVGAGNEIYIVAGPNGQGGTSDVGTFNTVNAGVVVPAFTWKIIVVLPIGNDDINRISTTTRVIAVKMPNSVTCSDHPWTYYRVSVDELETLTGYDFLSNVSDAVENVIEASVDNL